MWASREQESVEDNVTTLGEKTRAGARGPFAPKVWPLALGLAVAVVLGVASLTASVRAPHPAPRNIIENLAPLADRAPEQTMSQAWGSPAITRIGTALDAAHRFIFGRAITPDGVWLVGSIEPRLVFGVTRETPTAVLWNIHTREITTLHKMSTIRSQLTGAAANDRWIVWAELQDALRSPDWAIFAWNRATGQLAEVAHDPQVDGVALAGSPPSPALQDDTVIWSQPEQVPGEAGYPLVAHTHNLVTQADATLVAHAYLPQLVGQALAWLPDSTAFSAAVSDVGMRRIRGLPGEPSHLALHGLSLALCDDKTIRLVNDVSTGAPLAATISRLTLPRQCGDISLSARLLAWEDDPSPVVWDRVLSAMVRLPVSAAGGWRWASDAALIWSEPEPDAQAKADFAANRFPADTLAIMTPRSDSIVSP
ncbi:MAG TPA: hypothetical protein VF807_07105 [Ktedonobacterales bacterium]